MRKHPIIDGPKINRLDPIYYQKLHKLNLYDLIHQIYQDNVSPNKIINQETGKPSFQVFFISIQLN